MTRKHFELIASVLKKHLAYCDEQAGRAAADFHTRRANGDTSTSRDSITRWNEREKALQAVTASFAAEFASVNPHFSQSLFLKACQPEIVED
jgi:hypothetical protein